jgi:NAD(P)-dependent dehydrogenase (short-subunit alcohol dehydrogenase family)
MAEQKPVCVVVGVGPGNGAALARRFAKEGYRVALLARSTELSQRLAAELPSAKAYACDVGDAASVERAFAAIRSDLGEVAVLVYNAGSGVWGTIDDISAEQFEAAWRVNALGGFLASQQVIPAMKRAGQGSIVFIGATASRRGVPRTTAFAPAKAAQRSLAEAMARHLWKEGIHVALVVVDGVVDLPRTREWLKDKPDAFFVKPDDVASVVFQLTQQARSAWSFEVEARPFGESW